jgi:hypothetical protein
MVINKKIKHVRILCVTRRSGAFCCLRGVDKSAKDPAGEKQRIRNRGKLFLDPYNIQGVIKISLDDPQEGKRRSSGG